MKIIIKYVWILFAGWILTSCITTQSVPIDQMEPGKIALPASVRKVALISRNFKFSIDTLSGYFKLDFRLRKGTKSDNLIIDSIGVTQSLDNLRKALLESGRFDEVFVYPFKAIDPRTGDKELPFTSGFIKSLCAESETDAVICLEMLSFFYSRHGGTTDRRIQAEASVKVNAIWSVYDPKRENPVDRFTHSETIKWNEFNNNNNKQYKLPGRKEGISIACGVAAKNYSKRIVPYWAESYRVIIGMNGSEWENALSFAAKNKWQSAASIWKKYLESPQKRVSGIASLNYAVAQEMLGDQEKANLWSEKATALLKTGEPGRIAREYAGILYQRKLKTVRLNSLLKNSQ